MRITDLLKDIDPRWHTDFRRFVTTGKLSVEFEEALDHDISLQRAVDAVLDANAEAFDRLDAALEASTRADEAVGAVQTNSSTSYAANLVVQALLATVRAPQSGLSSIANAAIIRLNQLLTTEEKKRLPSVVERIEDAVGSSRSFTHVP
jgi:hypothetical protein